MNPHSNSESESPIKRRSLRHAAVVLHRYAGLLLAGFLFLTGVTGSIIAFHHELDRWLNPGVLTVTPSEERLPPKDWIAAAETLYSNARVMFVTVPRAEDEPAVLFLEPRTNPETGDPYRLAVDQVFVDPGNGEVLGSRDRDGFRLDRLHLIPFIYTLHYSLHLGEWGMWLLGGLAVIWFFDTFVGLYLAWPRHTWRTIKRALTVKWNGRAARINFDLHRAGGLWVWILLLILAFSGMSMNLHEELFDPMMEAVSPMTPWPGDVAAPRENPSSPLDINVEQAVRLANNGLAEAGMSGSLGAIWLNHYKGLYHIGFHTKDDIMSRHPGTWVSVGASDSRVVDVRPPGGHTVGDQIHDWQFPLHSGKAFGLTGRIIISLSGLVLALLSVTGVIIWWRKRKARRYVKKGETYMAESFSNRERNETSERTAELKR